MSLALASADPPPLHDEKIYQLVRAGWTVVAAGVRDEAWIQLCAQVRPGARYLVFPHDARARAGLERSLKPFSNDVTVNPGPVRRLADSGAAIHPPDQVREDRPFN